MQHGNPAATPQTELSHVQPGGELGYFQTRFNVYDRAGIVCPTPDCGKLVKRLVQSGRSTFYCAHCQR